LKFKIIDFKDSMIYKMKILLDLTQISKLVQKNNLIVLES